MIVLFLTKAVSLSFTVHTCYSSEQDEKKTANWCVAGNLVADAKFIYLNRSATVRDFLKFAVSAEQALFL